MWAHTPANQTTWLAADINSGYGDSKPGWYSDGLGVIDGRLYFDADDGINGRELWVYDPSNASSWRLTDIAPGSGSGVVCCSRGYIGDTFYLAGDDGINGEELWAYDSSNGSSWLVENINTWSTADSNPKGLILIGNTIYFRATDGSTGAEMYAYQPAEITSSGSSGTCSISPGLPTGLNIDSSTCTISGTPTVATTNTTYTITAAISGITYQTSVWLSSENYQLTPSVEGADLFIGEAMTPITFSHSYQIPQGYVTSGNNTTWYLQPTPSSQSYVLPCYQPNMVEMGDYYLAECEDDLSILDFNAGTRTTIISNAHPYNHQTNSKLLWSVEADGTRYYMLQNGSMYEFDEVARDLV